MRHMTTSTNQLTPNASTALDPDCKMSAIKEYTGPVCHLGWDFGFIKHGNTQQDNIYFHKSKVVAGLFHSIRVNDIVICDAEIVANHNSRYRATTVQVQIDPGRYDKENASKSDKSTNHINIKGPSVLCNVEGTITKVLAQGAMFRFADQSRDSIVHFDVNDFYDDGQKVMNLEWCLKVGDKVNFDALLDDDNKMWRAVVVWMGRKPNCTSIIDKMKSVELYLEKICPLIRCNDEITSDVPIVTVSSVNCSGATSEFDESFRGAAEDDPQSTVNQDADIVYGGYVGDQVGKMSSAVISNCQIM